MKNILEKVYLHEWNPLLLESIQYLNFWMIIKTKVHQKLIWTFQSNFLVPKIIDQKQEQNVLIATSFKVKYFQKTASWICW
jgi:hypothetical protein